MADGKRQRHAQGACEQVANQEVMCIAVWWIWTYDQVPVHDRRTISWAFPAEHGHCSLSVHISNIKLSSDYQGLQVRTTAGRP